MRAARYYAPRDIRIENVEMKPPEGNEVQVRIKGAGICGSDLHNYRKGMFMDRVPIITGHEFVGIVEQTGPLVKGLKPGDHVVADSRVYCGKCEDCKQGRYNLCAGLGFLGEVCEGAFAEFAVLSESQFFKLPLDLPLEKAVLLEPFAVSLHLLRSVKVEAGSHLGIVGAGPIGLLALLAARELFKCRVSIVEPSMVRREKALQLGAETAVEPTDRELEKYFSSIPLVIEAVGRSAAFNTALKLAAKGGTVVLAGLFEDAYRGDINLITEKELTIKGVNGFTNSNIYEAIKLIHGGHVDPSGVIFKRVGLEDINEAFNLMDNPEISDGKVIVEP